MIVATNSPLTQPVIMQVIPELGTGGAEQGCIDMAAEIMGAGAQAIVVSHGGPRIHELARIGAVHITLPVHRKNPFVMWQNIKKLRTLIKRYDVNIVHARSRAPAWSAWRACQKTGAHFITTCHAPYNIKGEAKRLYNSSIVQGEIVIAISNYVATYLKENYRISDERIRIIHRGVALEKFHPTAVTAERLITLSTKWRIPDGANIIMMPGRLTRWKGHQVLIEAISQLQRSDVFCVLIGPDQGRTQYRQELEAIIRAKNIGDRVRIVDDCNDMPAAYMLAGVVVSASTDPEGFGRVPVEAQAMGRPVIATDHGGAQETIVRGETGWLIPPSDPEALAHAIEEALALQPTQRSILATRAMAHIAQNFTREQMTSKTMDVYAEVLKQTIARNPYSNQPFHGKIKSPGIKTAAK